MFSADAKRRAAEEDHRWVSKIVLRLVAAVFAIIAVGLFSASIHLTNTNFINTEGPGGWYDGLALAPAVLALLYNPLDILVHLVVRKGRPAHPAFHVGMDLLVWALLVPSIIVALAGGIFWYWTPGFPGDDGAIDCSFFFNTFTRQCSPVAYQIGNMEIAGLVFEFFLFVIHLSLFVYAATDLHRKRVAKTIVQSDFDMELRKDVEHGSFSQRSA